MAPLLLLATLLLAASSLARDVPDNVRNLYDSIREKGMCSIELAGGFYSSDDGPNSESCPRGTIPTLDSSLLLMNHQQPSLTAAIIWKTTRLSIYRGLVASLLTWTSTATVRKEGRRMTGGAPHPVTHKQSPRSKAPLHPTVVAFET